MKKIFVCAFMGLCICAGSLSAAIRLDAKARNELIRPSSYVNRLLVENQNGGSITGTGQDDRIKGGKGDDRLDGGDGNDGLLGNDGKDELRGGEGNDFLEGGPERDLLSGSFGDDRYIFSPGDGIDRVDDVLGKNLIAIADLSHSYKMWIKYVAGEYVISYGKGDEIHLSSATFKTLKFLSAGTLLTTEEFLQLYGMGDIGYPKKEAGQGGKVILRAGPLGGEVRGTPADEILIGGSGEDFLAGGGGNDEFRPGAPGGAMAMGGAGNDLYSITKDDGPLMIQDSGGIDELRFGPGIRPADISVRERGGQLLLLIAGVPQERLSGSGKNRWSVYFVQGERSNNEKIEKIVFSDGTSWSHDKLLGRKIVSQ